MLKGTGWSVSSLFAILPAFLELLHKRATPIGKNFVDELTPIGKGGNNEYGGVASPLKFTIQFEMS